MWFVVLKMGESAASRLYMQVADTIATLASADIRLWVLTGDKVETVNEGEDQGRAFWRAQLIAASTSMRSNN